MQGRWFGTSSTPMSVRQRIRGMSNNALDISGTVTPWLPMTSIGTADHCSYGWMAAAAAAARAAGYEPDNYNYVSYGINDSACRSFGLLNNPTSTVYTGPSNNVEGSAAHELGHNLGLHHANQLACTKGSTVVMASNTCTTTEYGDDINTMGYGCYTNAPFSAHERWLMGWDAGGTQTTTTSGTYTLTASDMWTGTTALRIPAPATPSFLLNAPNEQYSVSTALADSSYFIEYQPRTSLTGDTGGGVYIRIARTTLNGSYYSFKTHRFDANGSTSGVTLPVGGTFTDHTGGLQITLVSQGASTASVQVTRVDVAPTTPQAVRVAARTASSITVAWGASTDVAPGKVARYELYRQPTSGAPVLVATTAPTIRAATAKALGTNQTHSFFVKAVDTDGIASAPSTTITASTDVGLPTATKPFMVSAMSDTTALASWAPSTDNVGVSLYRVQRQIALGPWVTVAEVSPGSTSTTLSGLWAGQRYAFAVRAVDAAGNQSAAALATVTMTGTLVAPTTPAMPQVTPRTATSVTVSWQMHAGASSYQLVKPTATGGWAVVTETKNLSTVRGLLKAGTTYSYGLRAKNAAGTSTVTPFTITV